MMRFAVLHLIEIFVPIFLIGVGAQTIPPNTFYWGFKSNPGRTISQCETYTLEAQSLSGGASDPSQAAPPFSFHTYSPNKIGLVDAVGSLAASLSWTVRYPSGSQILATMVDSQGRQSGFPSVYTVMAGSTSSCLPSSYTSPITLTTNSTNLNMCDPLRIGISGGTGPYSLTIAMSNQNYESIATLGSNDDQYIWITRGIVGEQMLVSVSDANGQLSVSTGLISIGGSSDTTCGGLQSFSSNSNSVVTTTVPGGGITTTAPGGVITTTAPGGITTVITIPGNSNPGTTKPVNGSPGQGTSTVTVALGSASQTASTTTSSANTAIIVGSSLGGCALLLAGIIAGICWGRRRRDGVKPACTVFDGGVLRGHPVPPALNPPMDQLRAQQIANEAFLRGNQLAQNAIPEAQIQPVNRTYPAHALPPRWQ